jgi:hypothetical protein
MNPSGVRVPVAIALPRSQVLADLLSALASASFAGAESIWDQQSQLSGSDDQAFEVLTRKGEDPAAAVLAAHFLGRFAPRRTPLRWLHNLQSLLPEVADTYFLLAARMMADELNASRPEIEQLLQSAEAAPVCLFSRTRALLTQALRLRKLPVLREAPDARAKPGDFLNVAADAGGLEAFWGMGPDQPGEDWIPQHPLPPNALRIQMNEGLFVQ